MVPPPPPPPVVLPPSSQQNIPAKPVNAPPAVDVSTSNDKLVCSNSILNLSKLTIPIVPPGTKTKMLLRCPQIRKTVIELPFDDSIDSYLDLSKYIVGTLNLDENLKAIPYNKKGQPFFYNLDLMHTRLPKLDFSE